MWSFWERDFLIGQPDFLIVGSGIVGLSAAIEFKRQSPGKRVVVIASGSLGCVVGGYISNRVGSARVAIGQLSLSGCCCLIAPLIFFTPPVIFVPFLIMWGVFVVGDSPQFSTLNAITAPKNFVGTALTIATCIGFAITIFSIQLLSWLNEAGWMPWSLWVLLPGPIFGLFWSRNLLQSS